jgi:hypothetical protein
MARQTIDIGSTANDGTGDPLRTAFNKVNENFIEVYDGINVFDQDLNISNNVTFNEVSVNGGVLGQVYGDGIDVELTLKSPPGVGDTGYVALSSANEKSYVEVNNISIDLAVEYDTENFKKWVFDNSGNLTAPGIISATNVNATNSFGLPVYATDAARDTAIPSPQPGMMVFVTGGEGAGLQVRGATQWNPVGGLTGV